MQDTFASTYGSGSAPAAAAQRLRHAAQDLADSLVGVAIRERPADKRRLTDAYEPRRKGSMKVIPNAQHVRAGSEGVPVDDGGDHGPFTGRHFHPHPSFDATDGKGGQHSHLHSHSNDASHDHQHSSRRRSSVGGGAPIRTEQLSNGAVRRWFA